MNKGALNLEGNCLFSGLYLNELIYYGLKSHEVDEFLYDAYEHVLYALTQNPTQTDLEIILRRFEWDFLMACGYQLLFTQEAHSYKPIVESYYYTFIPGEGFVSAEKGIPGAHLLSLGNQELFDPAVLKTAKFIARKAIDHALSGQAIRTRELIK
jgi:DNA repair protein RecO (recombination protein O)